MIDLALLAGEWEIKEHFIGVGVNPNPLIPINARRFAVIFTYVNPTPNPPNDSPFHFTCRCYTSVSQVISEIGGFFIQQWTPFLVDFPHFGGLVQQAWNFNDGGTGGNIAITEIIQSAGSKTR